MAHELVRITANGTKLRVRTEEVVDEVPDSRLGSWPVLMDAARAASRAGRSSLWRAVRGINCEPRTESYKVNELMRKIEWLSEMGKFACETEMRGAMTPLQQTCHIRLPKSSVEDRKLARQHAASKRRRTTPSCAGAGEADTKQWMEERLAERTGELEEEMKMRSMAEVLNELLLAHILKTDPDFVKPVLDPVDCLRDSV